MRSIARTFVFSLLTMASALTSAEQTEIQRHPFSEKPLARPHIHVESLSLFRPWVGGDVALGAYDPTVFKRLRLGTISLAAGLQAHLDAVQNTIHFPSYFELVHARTGKVLGTFPVLGIQGVEWYFNGNGVIYSTQEHLSLCDIRSTRKFVATEKAVVEVPQPILYVGAETDVAKNMPLYESPTSSTVVATVAVGTKVTVLGVRSGPLDEATPPLLVKTPFGLTGWHRRDLAGGTESLQIYLCR